MSGLVPFVAASEAEYDEKKHKRDKTGKFAKKESNETGPANDAYSRRGRALFKEADARRRARGTGGKGGRGSKGADDAAEPDPLQDELDAIATQRDEIAARRDDLAARGESVSAEAEAALAQEQEAAAERREEIAEAADRARDRADEITAQRERVMFELRDARSVDDTARIGRAEAALGQLQDAEYEARLVVDRIDALAKEERASSARRITELRAVADAQRRPLKEEARALSAQSRTLSERQRIIRAQQRAARAAKRKQPKSGS